MKTTLIGYDPNEPPPVTNKPHRLWLRISLAGVATLFGHMALFLDDNLFGYSTGYGYLYSESVPGWPAPVAWAFVIAPAILVMAILFYMRCATYTRVALVTAPTYPVFGLLCMAPESNRDGSFLVAGLLLASIPLVPLGRFFFRWLFSASEQREYHVRGAALILACPPLLVRS